MRVSLVMVNEIVLDRLAVTSKLILVVGIHAFVAMFAYFFLILDCVTQ